MKWAGVLVILAATVAAADDKPKKDDKTLEPFQGTWAVTAITQSGTEVPADEVKKLTLHVTGDERVIKAGDEVKSKAKYSVDPAKNPKTIDVAVSEGTLAGKTVRGIYKLEGDTLTVCLALAGDRRPDDFTAKEGSDRLLQVFKKTDAKGTPKDAPKKPDVKEPKLRDELLARMKDDQGVRAKLTELTKKNGGKQKADDPLFAELFAEMEKVDAANRAWVKEVVEKHGWPGFALVGKDGERAAFLLVQHAAGDREFQKKCLELLAAAVEAKDAAPPHLAYLTDRVRVVAGEKQLYGTQLTSTKDGEVVPSPIEDEANVDARRKEVGLMPLAEYLKLVRGGQGTPQKK